MQKIEALIEAGPVEKKMEIKIADIQHKFVTKQDTRRAILRANMKRQEQAMGQKPTDLAKTVPLFESI